MSVSFQTRLLLIPRLSWQRVTRKAEVANLKQDTAEGARLRKDYFLLLRRFPESTVVKLGEDLMRTELGRAKAVTQLVMKHSGEVLELDKKQDELGSPFVGARLCQHRVVETVALYGGWSSA